MYNQLHGIKNILRMTPILIFIAVIAGINCIPMLIRTDYPKIEKVIVRILIITSTIFLTFTIFDLNGLRLKGIYTLPTIGLTFIISALLYFGGVKNTKKKIVTVILITPLIVLSIFTLLFGRVLKEFEINDTYKIAVSTEGFLSCGEHIELTKTKFGIFNEEIYHTSNLCLTGITKIETLNFSHRQAVFLVYHNGVMDSENPYKYKIENKKVW